jgi:hypothetical protein
MHEDPRRRMSGADETVGLAGLVYDVRAMQALLERIARRQRTQTRLLQALLGLVIALIIILGPAFQALHVVPH